MSKVSFRARQIDFNKPLPILKNDSDLLSEFNETALVNRGVPQIPSGMEKEEENEHHFVEVIQALQLRDESDIKIPVPDIIDRCQFFRKTYPSGFSLPKQLIHIRSALFADDDDIDYDMDSEDEEWLRKSCLDIAPEKFESMMYRLERGCGQRVMNLEEAKCLLQEDPSLAIAVYDYWLSKRVQSRQPLLYSVRQEKRDNNSNCDPYVAFRRRSEKMQTRKNRKNDEQSDILSRLVKREDLKESLLQCELKCFQSRFHLSDWDGNHLLESELFLRNPLKSSESNLEPHPEKVTCKRSARKRKLTQRALDLSVTTQTSDEISDTERCTTNAEPFAFVRLPGCRYLKPRMASSRENVLKSHQPHLRYSLTTVPVAYSTNRTYTGYVRRRLGRGGRVICDRVSGPEDISAYLASINDVGSVVSDASSHSYSDRLTADSLDATIFRRLKPVILSNHRSKPHLRWPLCENIEPVPFESLEPTTSPLPSGYIPMYRSPPSPLLPANPCCIPKNDNHRQTNGLDLSSPDHNQLSRGLPVPFKSSAPVDQPDQRMSRQSISPPTQTSSDDAVAFNVDLNESSPHKLWQQLRRRYSPRDGMTDHPRPRDTELPKNSPNGVHRISHTPDDRLLRKESSLLPPKLYRVARDCVSIEQAISGAQLQTTNGLNSTQFCQLPT